ncbi:MAG: hypothetical protein JO006_13185 [Paucibacter sp.]|nr:hypothetical protein [Roseateles sp.]
MDDHSLTQISQNEWKRLVRVAPKSGQPPSSERQYSVLYEMPYRDLILPRVIAAMVTPYDKLEPWQAHERMVIGAYRTRENCLALNRTWNLNKAAAFLARTGNPWGYWEGYWRTGCNTLPRLTNSSTPEIIPRMIWEPPESIL